MPLTLRAATATRIGTKSLLLVSPTFPPARADGKKRGAEKGGTTWKRFHPQLVSVLKELDREAEGAVQAAVDHHDYQPGAGKRLDVLLDSKPSVLRISGISDVETAPADEWRKAGGDLAQQAARLRLQHAELDFRSVPTGVIPRALRAAAEGILLGSYEFMAFKGTRAARKPAALSDVTVIVAAKDRRVAERALHEAEIAADAVRLARDLVNTPPTDMQPKVLLQQARRVASRSRGKISMKSFGQSQLRRMGAGGLLGVARGSEAEPFLLHLTYRPARRTKASKRIVLIGKGVTFDCGGLSIKTGKGMEDMKCDMAGAACVISTMQALGALARTTPCVHEVHVLVPTTENMINGNSVKPGDVLRAMNGKTIEVLNTDAEGRLILADALSYAERIRPDCIIDLATLTGACIVALGSDYAGLFSTSDEWTNRLQEASRYAGEQLWRLPLAEEYRPQLESDVADLRNIGTGGPGAILAALFLKEFVPNDAPWIHLDIAGPAFGTKSNEYTKRGATGFGVLSLLTMLTSDEKA